jgi:putative ABC transport system permease protein
MFRNFLIIALRNLRRNKLHALINIVGLSIGISACLVLFLIVDFELGFDKFRQDRDRIYRVYSSFSGVFEGTNRGVATGVAPFLQDNISGIEALTHFHTMSAPVETAVFGEGHKDHGRQSELVIAGPEFFDVFPDYQWIAGTPAALGEPHKVVLSEHKAQLYFGVDDPAEAMGREVFYRDSLALTVAGIIANPVDQTDLYFEDFIAYATIESSWLKDNYPLNDWNSTNSSSQLFLKLAPGVSGDNISEQLTLADERYAKENAEDEWRAAYHLQPFADLHFNTELHIFDNGRAPAHLPTLYALILVAALLLLIAAINFVNLETAQAIRRSKEVGVRKVFGSSRRTLILQFLGETLLLTLIAVVLSVQLANFALYYFEDFIPDGVALQLLDIRVLLFLLAITLVAGLLAGAYPAFVLSSFRPVRVLKDQVVSLRGDTGRTNLRRGLIVFQFIIAQVLIFGALIVGQQINFMINKDMGFRQDAIINFYAPWRTEKEKREVLKQELTRIPGIELVSRHSSPPARRGYSTTVMKHRQGEEMINYNVHRKYGDTAFIHLYGIELLAGRNITPSDTVKELLINETFARRLGFVNPAEAIGEQILVSDQPKPVVGVVKDFHIRSLHYPIEPTAIASALDDFYGFGLKLRTRGKELSNFEATVEKIEKVWKRLYPDNPFDYTFLDEDLAKFYEAEKRTAKLVRTATGVAILISCLGLLGLISYTTTQRTKEIGIRKVLGAGILNIVRLLTADFMRLILLASLVALPLAWYFTSRWLEDFAYRIRIEWWMFLLVCLAALAVTLLTVGYRAYRAATANPAESLKYE